jgi:hypothetical protein
MKGPRDTFRDRLRFYRSKQFSEVVGAALFAAADWVRAEAHRSISAGSVSGKSHQPSSPGTPPNRDTGTLQAHTTARLVSPTTSQVRSDAPYSARHEFGPEGRAFIRPARDKIKDKAGQHLRSQINKAAKRARSL